jgi:hypothetical protein
MNLVGKITTHANSPVTLNTSRARLGLTDEAINNIRIDFTQHHTELPNGLFHWKGHGYYMSEQVGVSRMITELLLQSAENIILLFPAWPIDEDAEFAGLRTQGGFLISAKLSENDISNVKITSTVGGIARIVNPWPGHNLRVTNTKSGNKLSVTETDGIASFATQKGRTYRLSK